MTRKSKKLYFALTLALSLAACGGSNTSESTSKIKSPESTINAGGKVIDGYVVGATVWLDFNGDGKHDQQTEPSTISGESGDYSFDFTKEEASCVPYATTYVDVPVGAIDLDLGEVTDAYQMSFPPSIEPISDGDIRNISPLTSVIWGQLQSQLQDSNEGTLTCEKLKQDSKLRNEIKNEIESVMINLVEHYNLSEEQIYSDFIAANDSETYDRAQAIVKGLKAAYKYQQELKEIHPEATEIRVTVSQDLARDKHYGFTDVWYRDVYVIFKDENFSELVTLTDDETYATIDLFLSNYREVEQLWGDQDLKGSLSTRYGRHRSHLYQGNTAFQCGKSETIKFEQNGVEYQLVNTFGYDQGYSSFEECSNEHLVSPYQRTYYFHFAEENRNYFTELEFAKDHQTFNTLSDWVNVKDKSEALAPTEMISQMSAIAIGWDDEVLVDNAYWRKRMWYDNIVVDKNNDNEWVKSTKHEDNTKTYECSADGVSWLTCAGE
jgi:hypothetical protein